MGGGGFFKANKFKEMYEASLGFPELGRYEHFLELHTSFLTVTNSSLWNTLYIILLVEHGCCCDQMLDVSVVRGLKTHSGKLFGLRSVVLNYWQALLNF